jgi:geranylgeranyl diphosphate synthase type I
MIQGLLEADVPGELRLAMVGVQTGAAAGAILGQVMDPERAFQALPDEDFLHAVADRKSGRYAILAPCASDRSPSARTSPHTRTACAGTRGL